VTAKGAKYAKEQLEQRRKRLLKSMNLCSSEIRHLPQVSVDIPVVEAKQQEFSRLAAEFEDVNTEYRQLLTEQ